MTRFFPVAIATALTIGSAAHALDIELRQLNWLNDDGSMGWFASPVGEIELHFDQLAPEDQIFLVSNGGGFVNVVLQPNGNQTDWVVQNLYMAFPDPAYMGQSSPSVQFRLPIQDSEIVEFANYVVMVTPQPLDGPPMDQPQFVNCQLVDYHAGGFAGGGSGIAATPFLIGLWIGPFDFPIDWAWTSQTAEQIAEIDEDINGCHPGSAARSIDYLGDTNDFDTDDAQDIYDDLYDDMDTDETGTADQDMLDGKNAYTEREGLPIVTELVYNFADQIDAMIVALRKGADLEILISWTGGGGHAAMVTSIVKHADGSYTITYVDDPEQGDGEAENEEHTIKVNADGTFDGGVVDGFMVEKFKQPGDVDGDGDVDQQDIGLILAAYGSSDGDPNFNGDADFDGDGDVDQADLGVLLGNYGAGL